MKMALETVVTIEKLVHGGEGLARLPDGRVVFVPDTIPGEEVRIRVVQNLGDYSLARVEEILSPSPLRQEPACPYFGRCGGCQFQHLPYEAQLEEKLEIFKETLARVGKIEEDLVSGIEPSPKAFGYRNRLQFHVHQERGALGFLKRRSHDLVPVRSCLLTTPEVNQVIEALPEIPAWRRLHPYVKRVNLGLSPLEGKVVLLFWTKLRPSPEDLAELLEALPVLKAIFYWIRGRAPEGPFPKEAAEKGRRLFPVPAEVSGLGREQVFLASAGVFVQANWEVNLKLIEFVRKKAGLSPEERVLDVHCGIGNFLLPLAASARAGLGVDTDRRAIADGQENASRWGLENVLLRASSAIEALIDLFKEAEGYEAVVLDPPRGGCKEILRFLPEVAQERLIYVSCDPPTLARDLRILREGGFEIEEIRAFDMFPQTFHLESVTILRRK